MEPEAILLPKRKRTGYGIVQKRMQMRAGVEIMFEGRVVIPLIGLSKPKRYLILIISILRILSQYSQSADPVLLPGRVLGKLYRHKTAWWGTYSHNSQQDTVDSYLSGDSL